MKKLAAILATAGLLMLCLLMTASAAVGDTFAFGGDDPIDGQDGSAQGQNGWYYMWSPEHDKNGDLDVSKIQESVASDYGSLMFMWGSGLYVDGEKGWVPDLYADDENYDSTENGCYWLQLTDGTLTPGAISGPQATNILGFKAPADGCYWFYLKANAGNKDTTDTDCDGVTVSINTAAGKLYTKKLSGAVADHETEVQVMLKKDEFLYFAVDPNASGGNDSAKLTIEGEVVGKYFAVDNQKTFLFGGAEGAAFQDGSAQGQNGWYYLWSPEHDKAGQLDLSKIKESVASDYGSLMFAWGVGLYVNGEKGWVPDIYADDENYDSTENGCYWMQLIDGTMTPGAIEGPQASNIIGFKAPKAGEYTFDLTANAGNKEHGAEDCDGVFLSVNTAAGVLYSQDAGAAVKEYKKSVTATLAAGEFIYFVVDPKANGGNDDAALQVYATLVKETVATVPSVTTTTAAATTAGTENNPGTGTAMPLAIAAIGLAAGGALLVSRKRGNA